MNPTGSLRPDSITGAPTARPRGVQKPGSRSESGVGTEIDSFGVP